MHINLSDPFWGIKHLALALDDITVDAAREYTYRDDFPAPKGPFKANLWLREEVIGWFAQLPSRTNSRTNRTIRRSHAQQATRLQILTTPVRSDLAAQHNQVANGATAPVKPSTYRPRRKKPVAR